jgi:hypothetical protein
MFCDELRTFSSNVLYHAVTSRLCEAFGGI